MMLARCTRCGKAKVFPPSKVNRSGNALLPCAQCKPGKVEAIIRLPRKRAKQS